MSNLRLLSASMLAFSLAAGSAVAQTAPAQPAAAPAPVAPDRNALSYALGYDLGAGLAEAGENIDTATVLKGLQDAYAKKEPTIPGEKLGEQLQAMQARQVERQRAAYEKAATDNKARSDAFIAQNKTVAGVQTLPGSTVQYRVLEAGTGAKPTQASTVQFEISVPFVLGQRPQQVPAPQQVPGVKLSEIQLVGLREALLAMPAGSKWEITLPPEKAFGADPRTGFPPNAAVQYELRLISAK